MFMQWKGRLPEGAVYDQPVIALDILPTAVAAGGGEVKPEWKLDGVNLLPHLLGKGASLLKGELEDDPVWTAFATRANQMKRHVYQTELAFWSRVSLVRRACC